MLTAFFKNSFTDPYLRAETKNLEECGLHFRAVVSNGSRKTVLKLKSPFAGILLVVSRTTGECFSPFPRLF